MNPLQRMKFNGLKKKLEKFYQQREEGDNKAAQKELLIHKEIAHFYEAHPHDKNLPQAELLAREHYRAAAMLGDKDAQYAFASRMMKQGNFWQSLSDTPLNSQAQIQYTIDCYQQAHNYLEQAIERGHPLAKRLKGHAIIKGWGVDPDMELGTRLIIESIKEEGTWDKANEIFEKLGLHSPEIFTALMSARDKEDT